MHGRWVTRGFLVWSAIGFILVLGNALPAASLAAGRPARLELVGIVPNPFADGAAIRLAVPTRSPVRLEVFDVQGRRVRVLVDREYRAGVHVVGWDVRDERGTRVRPGVYLCRLTSGNERATKRLLVLSPN